MLRRACMGNAMQRPLLSARRHLPFASLASRHSTRVGAAPFAPLMALRFNSTTADAHFGAFGDAEDQVQYDPWAVLGLKPGASPHDLRLRYHELLTKYHPDFVPKGEAGDVETLQKVEQAYQLITKSPTLDKRYQSLVSDTQRAYYRFLPMWMAKNVDEMPRYWSWLRWKLSGIWFWGLLGMFTYVYGKMAARYPFWAICVGLAFLCDMAFHIMLTPAIVTILLMKSLFGGNTYNLTWLQSPKGFLIRGLTY